MDAYLLTQVHTLPISRHAFPRSSPTRIPPPLPYPFPSRFPFPLLIPSHPHSPLYLFPHNPPPPLSIFPPLIPTPFCLSPFPPAAPPPLPSLPHPHLILTLPRFPLHATPPSDPPALPHPRVDAAALPSAQHERVCIAQLQYLIMNATVPSHQAITTSP